LTIATVELSPEKKKATKPKKLKNCKLRGKKKKKKKIGNGRGGEEINSKCNVQVSIRIQSLV
jgi:hypothetical protein